MAMIRRNNEKILAPTRAMAAPRHRQAMIVLPAQSTP